MACRLSSGLRNSLTFAIQREKTLKHYVRAWKINLIERTNPHWVDLYPTLPGVAPVPQLVSRRALDPRDKPEDDNKARSVGVNCELVHDAPPLPHSPIPFPADRD
jgi:hypothetical protein